MLPGPSRPRSPGLSRPQIQPRVLRYEDDSSTDTEAAPNAVVPMVATSTPVKAAMNEQASSDEGPAGPRGLAEPTVITDGDNDLEQAEMEIALDTSTGDTILLDDISDCRFSSADEKATLGNDKPGQSNAGEVLSEGEVLSNNEENSEPGIVTNAGADQDSSNSTSTTSDSSSESISNEEPKTVDGDEDEDDVQRYGADDTRDGGPYEAERVLMSASQIQREREDERTMNRAYPEIYWCAWCSRPNSILNDVPIAHRRVSINTSAEELGLVQDEQRIYPMSYTDAHIDYAQGNTLGLPSYDEVFHARVQNGQYNRVTPPDTYSPINPPAYGGVQTNSDDDAGEDV